MNENKKVQVSFVIDEDIYSEYKAILAIERTRVTTDIVKYIEKRVQDNLKIDKELFKRVNSFSLFFYFHSI